MIHVKCLVQNLDITKIQRMVDAIIIVIVGVQREDSAIGAELHVSL